MKYKRKKIAEVEAYFMPKRTDLDILPMWLYNSIVAERRMDGKFSVQTSSGLVDVEFPSWFIREPEGKGAYPVSVEYFEDNFERVEG